MFYKMIDTARDRWFSSDSCTVKPLVDYIIQTGQMRDAQVGAIKTYLYLKIACGNQSLASLFQGGAFNSLNLDEVEVSGTTRAFLSQNPAAAALYEYAGLKNDAGEQVSAKVEQQIKRSPDSIDYNKFFLDAFYGVTYTDYLFSLPMGAGKTYLMAAFIYLDLYFALNEPTNAAFAHNFIIFAPSGLKSSVVPSLRTIQKFDPAWVIPEPSAGVIKRKMLFEVLDQSKTAKKSNKTKNPNVQKIALHLRRKRQMAKRYIPFIPEPVEGQAVLANFARVLKYRGAGDVSTMLERGMPLYEMKCTEAVGRNDNGNLVIRGECISACAFLKERGISIDLVYIDPPFASGADYAKKVYIRRNPKVAEAIAAAEQELDIDELKSFEEKMYGDVWDKEKYLNWMYENLMAIKSVMSETASIYVHLDWHIGHYVKVLMDEVFGEASFRNEIVWCYSGGGIPKNEMPHKHDTIFWYSIGSGDEEWNNQWIFNPEYRDYSPGSVQRGRTKVKGENAKLREEGTPINDWWSDVPKITSPTDPEKLDYATQKSEALLSRIINTSSDKGMLVADFFGGSGVAAAVSAKTGRRFIHCDIGINSIQTTRDRLKAIGASFDVLEIRDGVSLYRNPVQTMDKIKSLIPGLRNEDSLDSFWEGAIADSKLGTLPVYVPNLMDSNSKLLDVVLMNRIIHQAIPELDAGIKKVVVYYVDITSEEEIRRFIADDESTTVEIELRDLKAILDDVVVSDYADYQIAETHNDRFDGYTVTMSRFASDRVMGKIEEFNQKALLNSSAKKPYKPIEISESGLELIEFITLDCTAAEGEWHSDSEIKIDKFGYVIRNGEKTRDFWDGRVKSDRKPLRMKIRNICGDESVWAV